MIKTPETKVVEQIANLTESHWFNGAILGRQLSEQPLYTLDRIMEMVVVLQRQAESIKRRIELTDAVHQAQYNFKPNHNTIYWLIFDSKKGYNILSSTGPDDWFTGAPEYYQYLYSVKWLGDHTWIEVDKEGNPI